MAELKTHSNFESVLNPDDKKLSEDFSKNRVQEVAQLASARINEISGGRGRGVGGGLEGFFSALEDHSISEASPSVLANQVRNRVMNVVGNTGIDAANANNGSSASILDTGLWNYTRATVLTGIERTRRNTLSSLTVVEGYKQALSAAQAGALEQFNAMKSRQEEIIENRVWWRKAGNRLAKIATLGAYGLVERKKRQKFFNSIFEKRMQRRFNDLNRNIKTLEKEATSRKDRMKSHMERAISAAHTPTRKAQLRKQLLDAVQHTGNLNTINLPNWPGLDGTMGMTGAANAQEVVDFLEAAKEMDFVKNDLAAIGISKAKNAEQKGMIDSAQEQQELFSNLNNFKFETIKKDKGFKDLDLGEFKDNPPEIPKLVEKIENDLKGNGIDLEDLYTDGGKDLKKSDLLVDSSRLILLVKKIRGLDASKKLRFGTRQMLLSWIESMDKNSRGQTETHDRTNVLNQLTILDQVIKSAGGGITKSALNVLDEAKKTDLTKKKHVDDLKTDINTLSGELQTKYSEFLDKKGTKYFPDKDFKLIKESWDEVMKSREFLIKQIDKWTKEQEKYKAAKTKLGELNDKIEDLNNPTKGKIRKSINSYNLLCKASAKGKYAQKDKAIRLKQLIEFKDGFKAELKELENERQELKDFVSLPEFSDLSDVQKYLDALTLKSGKDLKKQITKKKKPILGDLNERIQQELRSESFFMKEINDKFVEELAKNDQYETLKTVSEGTKVKLTYKKLGGSKNLDFPSELKNSDDETFTVIRQDKENGHIHLQNGANFMTISNPAAEGKDPYKNAVIRKRVGGGGYNPRNPIVGGAADHAIVYNMRIAA